MALAMTMAARSVHSMLPAGFGVERESGREENNEVISTAFKFVASHLMAFVLSINAIFFMATLISLGAISMSERLSVFTLLMKAY